MNIFLANFNKTHWMLFDKNYSKYKIFFANDITCFYLNKSR